jgi:putative hydrolase of the HAD superfamily
MASDAAPARALLVDWGGVMTTNLFASFASFCARERLEMDALARRLREDEQARALVVGLETGRVSEADFEQSLGAALGVAPEGLVDRLFADSGPDDAMQEAVLHARRAGIPTGLLSNSWGTRRYPRERLDALFDAVTISGEVGLRKPAAEIYELAAQRIGVAPRDCVFVDDIPSNLEPARRLGMRTVHHVTSDETIPELERQLGTPLR